MNWQWVLLICYIALIGLCLVAREREFATGSKEDGVWPLFWLLTIGLLFVMAFGRIGDAGSSLGDLGRRALGDGYAGRRPFQVGIVAALGVGWLSAISICWRTPQRRRRYLPMGLMMATLAGYTAVRVVSLHQIDAFLDRSGIGGIRVGTLIEIALLILAGLVTLWVPRAPVRATTDAPMPQPDHPGFGL